MTTPHYRASTGAGYTVDDLFDFPDDGYRYEILDGSLVVTPPPALPHIATTVNLRDRLVSQAPKHLRIIEGAGVYPNERNYYIPDLLVLPQEVLEGGGQGVSPGQTLLVIEVVSPSNPGADLIFKRELYAQSRIPEYWIADRRDRSLTILHLGDDDKYAERAVLDPGETWRTDRPFPLHIDPAEIF